MSESFFNKPNTMNERREFIKKSAAAASLSFVPKFVLSADPFELPKVLILGDSISIGYTPYVQSILKGRAEVSRPLNKKGGAENCQGTTRGLSELDRWLGDTKWDVIHFNFGLHDLKHVDDSGKNSTDPNDPQQADAKTYGKNLSKITKRLVETEARLIFATTTPYPDKTTGVLRRADQPEIYNAIALKIMNKHKIEINDLYAFVKPRMKELMRPANVHFTPEGSKILAKEVVSHIEKSLTGN